MKKEKDIRLTKQEKEEKREERSMPRKGRNIIIILNFLENSEKGKEKHRKRNVARKNKRREKKNQCQYELHSHPSKIYVQKQGNSEDKTKEKTRREKATGRRKTKYRTR